jgi:[acyl-carrier-protein] S-malonyltransferase
MGREWADNYPVIGQYFEEADRVLSRAVSSLIEKGPPEDLNRTVNCQPAVFVLNCACHALWKDLQPSAMAGHSLGEYSALVAGEVLDWKETLTLVKIRAELMQEDAERLPGAMLAVLGLEAQAVEQVVEENRNKGIVSIANYNCPGQVVVSCEEGLAEVLAKELKTRGAKKIVRLPVSGAFHSPLISSAASVFGSHLQNLDFGTPKASIVSNFSARGTRDPAEIRYNLTQQMSSPVRWEASVRWMLGEGISVFVELGPGRVLQGLIRRISKGAEVRSMEDAPLEELREWLTAKAQNKK